MARRLLRLSACLLLQPLHAAPPVGFDEQSLVQVNYQRVEATVESQVNDMAQSLGLSEAKMQTILNNSVAENALDTTVKAVVPSVNPEGGTPDAQKDKSKAGDQSSDSLNTMMKFLTGLFTAVRDENFMRTIHEMMQSSRKVVEEMKGRTDQVTAEYQAAVSKSKKQAELVELRAGYFNAQAHLMTKYYMSRHMINQKQTAKMPNNVEQELTPMLEMLNSQASVDATAAIHMETNASKAKLCAQVEVLVSNLTKMESDMSLAKKRINGTMNMFPMVKNYLDTLNPEVVPRVMWVLKNLMDTEFSGASSLKNCAENIVETVHPVLRERLECENVKKSGTRSQYTAGLFVALVVLVRALSLF